MVHARPTLTLVACALALIPLLAYAADPQFHFITENGNVFIISPPDEPRPANIIAETAHLSVHHPPAGMFVLTASNGTTQKVTPMQAGIDMSGFAGGKLRVILGSDWDSARDRVFRDQAFGTMSGDPLRHAATMPTMSGWNDTYEHVPLHGSSCFGLSTGGCTNNTLSVPGAGNGGYSVNLNTRDRVGMNFGPGTGADHTYYIYRGCSNCNAKVVVGHGNPLDPRETLPNNLTIVDHYRGWLSSGTCTVSESSTWSGSGSRTISSNYSAPGNTYSTAGNHYIDSRYASLSILPQSHSNSTGMCSVNLHTYNGDDNRKHDMCVTGTSTDVDSWHTYPCSATRVVEVHVEEEWVDGHGNTHIVDRGTTTTTTTPSCATRSLPSSGSCTTPTTSNYGTGYRVSATCTPGTAPPIPSPSTTTTTNLSTQVFNWPGYTVTERTTTTTTTTRTFSSPSTSTNGEVDAFCTRYTNTPYLDLNDAMSLEPGLNVYRPSGIPVSHNLLVIYDDAENGGGGSERIQVFRTDDPGLGPDIAGPYWFHLRQPASGILYDAHAHYGWVENQRYDTADLDDMGYTQLAAMAGHGDGIGSGGGPSNERRLCHGDCFMGVEGIDPTKPAVRAVAAAHTLRVNSSSTDVIYDHVNDRWFAHYFSYQSLAYAASLYLTIPFAEDVSIMHMRMYNDNFDPELQDPSPRNAPGTANVCHMRQNTLVGAFLTMNAVLNATNGESLHIPVIPGARYVAFIGNGDCYWYDVAKLPTPLSSVSSGARHVPLVNGTILTGDLTARHDGFVHVDVVADLTAVWQSEMYGVESPGHGGNATWVTPPLEVELVAVARVNGLPGSCGGTGIYCSDPISLTSASYKHGSYIHGTSYGHGETYARAPSPLPSGGTTGEGVYGMSNGRCYGLATVEADTGGITVRDIPNIRVSAGDTVTLSFEAVVVSPEVGGGNVTTALPSPGICMITEAGERAVLDVTMLTATLR